MFNEKIIKEREGLVVKNLVLDEISVVRKFFKERKYLKNIIDMDSPLMLLEDIYTSIKDDDVTDIKKEYKTIIIELLERRIDDLEEDFENNHNELGENDLDKNIKYISDFILYEYKLLYQKYLLSILKDNDNTSNKFKN